MNEKIYQEAFKEFSLLPREEKKKKLLELVYSFKETHPIFKEIREDIQTITYTDSQYLEIYKILLKSIYQIEKEWIDKGIQKIEQLHNFLVQLRARETEEKKKEWDIDIWLDKVLATLQ